MKPAKKPEARNTKVYIRTVNDLEAGVTASPSSPPATEEERANFLKILHQMNDMTVGDASNKNANLSKSKSSSDTSRLENSVGDNDLEKRNSVRRKRSNRRSGKKSNKASPTDSPLKSNHPNNVLPKENLQASGKDESGPSSYKEPHTVGSSSATTNSNSAVKGQPKTQNSNSHGGKVVQNSKPSKDSVKQEEPSRIQVQDSPVRLHSKDVKYFREEQNSIREVKGIKPPFQDKHLENGEVPRRFNPFERDPLILLRAAVNLIMPKNKDLTLFYCIPCDKEFFELDKHLEKSKESHSFKWKCEMRRRTIDLLPELSEKHIRLLDELVLSTVNSNKMPEERQQHAACAWQSLNSIAQTQFKDCCVRWFGSQVNGIALRENNLLNMDLLIQNKEEAASTFLRFIAAVEKDGNFCDVKRVVATNFAHANITHKQSGLEIQLSLNNTGAYSTAKLIGDYLSIDKRVKPLCIFFRVWGKMCGVDQGENGSWQGHAFPIMVIYFLQQERVLPVLHDMVDNPKGDSDIYLDPKNLQNTWTCHNKDSIGKLLFEMLRFYSIEHDVEKHVVCITQQRPYLRSDTKWNAKRIAVIDPFQPKHNISRYISANMYDYVHHCLITTTCTLGIPRTDLGPLFGYVCPLPESAYFHQTPDVLEEYMDVTNKIFDLVLRLDDSYRSPDLRKDNEHRVPDLMAHLTSSKVFRDLFSVMKLVPNLPQKLQPSSPARNAYVSWWITPFQAKCLIKEFRSDAFKLKFTEELCTDKEIIPIACTSCHKNGHLRVSCPDEVIPKMTPVPSPSRELNELLNRLCWQILESRSTETSEMNIRQEVLSDLFHFLEQYYRDIELHLFGSSLNGFGGKSSDIDLCLTFKSNPTGEGLNFPQLVEEMQYRLKGHRNVYRLLAITTAKVPIVKFEYGRARSSIQVDLSLYNRLGIMNTELLRTYSQIDERVRPIVYMMKCLAKTTGIGDASRGSLSSYAYSLMSLYFLQQVQPPVIPVLQELSDPNVGRKVEIVDGANVYFFKFQNLQKLNEVWPHRGKNKSTLGELWLQLLEFYATEAFHKSQKVVCIRKEEPLYKFDKLWTSTNICIEDPFDLNHNLGSGLSKRMNIFIVKTLQKACKHFSSLPKTENISSLEKYYFNENALSIGKPPSDRGCHFCHCIGHVQNDCPRRLALQGRQGGRPNGRVNIPGGPGNRVNMPGMAGNRGNNARPNYGFDNFNKGGSRREQGRSNRGGDPGRISNLPLPLNVPHAAQNLQHNHQPNVQSNLQPPHQSNVPTSSKPMNLQNHVIVGSMKPPGFPAVPPGHPLLGAPVRFVPPQMVQGPPPFMFPPPPQVQQYSWQ